jgi:hypothetical protein
MVSPAKKHETVSAPQVMFLAVSDPVFAVPGQSEFLANVLSLLTRNKAYNLIHLLSDLQGSPAFSTEIFKTSVENRGSVDKESLTLIVFVGAQHLSSSHDFLSR